MIILREDTGSVAADWIRTTGNGGVVGHVSATAKTGVFHATIAANEAHSSTISPG